MDAAPELGATYGFAVEPVPVLFAGLLEAHGQLGPAEVRPKALWMARNNLRKAVLLGAPLQPPAHHPFNPLLSLRLSSLPLPDEERRALIDALFQAVWVQGVHVSDPEAVEQVLAAAGLRGASSSPARSSPRRRPAFVRRPTKRSRPACSASPPCSSAASCSGATTISPISSCTSPGRIRSTGAKSRAGCRTPSAMRRRVRPGDGG